MNSDTNNESQKNQKTFSEVFYSHLRNLLLTSHLFKLSIDSLNKSNLIPNKDYNNDKLVSGMLQLPSQFHLVIDESQLSTGELNPKGT